MKHLLEKEDYRHVWKVSRKAWYVRLYLLVWRANPNEITFCKIWWGYVLMPLGIFLRVAALPLTLSILVTNEVVRRRREKSTTVKTRVEAEGVVRTPYIVVGYHPTVGRRTTFRVRHSRDENLWKFPGQGYAFYPRGNLPYKEWSPAYSAYCRQKSYRSLEKNYTFSNPGEYLVSALVRDEAGQQREITKTVKVYPKPALTTRILEGAAYGGAKTIVGIGSVASLLGSGIKTASKPLVPVGNGLANAGDFLGEKMFDSLLRTVVSVLSLFILVTTGIFLLFGAVKVVKAAPVGMLHTATGLAPSVGIGLLGVLAFVVVLAVWLFVLNLEVPQAAWRVVLAPFGKFLNRGRVGFFRAMRIGYVSVKSNTCPRVEVEDES